MIRLASLAITVSSFALVLAGTPLSARADEGPHHACREDAAKLCKDIKPGGDRLHACLKSHDNELSQGCKDAMAARHKK
jgi:hypothetical protein